MTFGAGVLIDALTFSLIEEDLNIAKYNLSIVVASELDVLSYSIANHMPNKESGTKHRKQSQGSNAGDGGKDASGKHFS